MLLSSHSQPATGDQELSGLRFISPATVARHIANIYRKLDVACRAAITACTPRDDLG